MCSYVTWMPKPGETVFGNSHSTNFGGKGANQSVAAAMLGARVAMIGCVSSGVNWPTFNIMVVLKA